MAWWGSLSFKKRSGWRTRKEAKEAQSHGRTNRERLAIADQLTREAEDLGFYSYYDDDSNCEVAEVYWTEEME